MTERARVRKEQRKHGNEMRMRWAAVLVGMMLTASCGDTVVPATEVILVIDSDLMPPDELNLIQIIVRGPTGDQRVAYAMLDVGDERLPHTLGIHLDGGPLGPYTVSARARLNGTTLVRRDAIFSFVEGQSMRLYLNLPAECQGVPCAEGFTCVEGAMCVTPEATLTPWDGSLTGGVDAGMNMGMDAGPMDAGAVMDATSAMDSAPMDAGSGDADPMDAGVEDAGPVEDGGADAGM